MGLDMYLLRKDLCRTHEEDGETYTTQYDEKWNKIPGAEAVYWHKANQIHKWFVDNAQGGVDDCQYSDPIPLEKLVKLRNLCEQVIQHPEDAEHLLPTQLGFFFGGQGYDEWYFSDLKSTIEELDKAMKEAPENAEFIYHSSW
jgi:hypothetical protein